MYRRQHITIPKDIPLPRGVKIIAWARAIRWMGWGFGESFIPVFIFSFSDTFAEAGLMRSIFAITALFSLPVIGAWADRVSAKHVILVGLLLYPLVGLGYFFAGLFSAAIFIALARAINGVLWGIDCVGTGTYYRRVADHDKIGSSFGYIESWSNVGWIAAALAGMVLVSYIPVHYLLLAISPAAIIAMFVALRAPKDRARNGTGRRGSFVSSYFKVFSEWRTWNSRMWLLGALVIFSAIIEALMWFFLPIDAYIEGAKPAAVVLLIVLATLPTLFGYSIGKVSDKRDDYSLIAFGLLGVALTMIGLVVFPQFTFKLLASFVLGVLLEVFGVVQKVLVTRLGDSKNYGQREGAFESVATLGDLAAPLVLGITLDSIGFTKTSLLIAGVAVVLCISYWSVEKRKRRVA